MRLSEEISQSERGVGDGRGLLQYDLEVSEFLILIGVNVARLSLHL